MKQFTIAVITNKNRKERWESFVENIKEQTDLTKHELLIVNNGEDNSMFEKLTEHTFISSAHGHVGLAEAWNISMSLAKNEWVVICNDDVLVNDKQWTTKLHDIIATNKQHCFLLSDPNGFSAFALSKTFWKRMGEFNSEFPSGYYEDDDFFLRCCKIIGCVSKAEAMDAIFYSLKDRTGKGMFSHLPNIYPPTKGWDRAKNKTVFDKYWVASSPTKMFAIENKNGVWYEPVRKAQ